MTSLPTAETPCYGKSALFDSIDPADHLEAANLCADCPVRAACEANTPRPQEFPEGTWAGVLYHEGRIVSVPKPRSCGICDRPLTDAHASRKYHRQCARVAKAAAMQRLRDERREDVA